MTTLIFLAALSVQTPAAADPTTLTGSLNRTYSGLKGFILKSAEKMPAEHFGFRPTADVRSYGQVLAHIADANYLLCSPAIGETNPNGKVMNAIEKQELARDALMAKLKETFEYCDKAYAALTDANAVETVAFFDSRRPRLSVLWSHVSHAYEHYGNLVTYLRLKGIVPPSSEPQTRR
jgi:uncharacterized damage-inducible protein DinB